MERNHTIDVLRGLAIVLMVLGHITRTGRLYQYIYSFHIPVFFALSGYLYNPEKFSSFASFLKRKFKGLIIPYLIFGLLTYLYWLLVERHFRPIDLDPLQQLVGLFWGSNYKCYMDFNIALWFIPCLFTMGVVFYCVDKAKHPIAIMVLSISIYFLGMFIKDAYSWLPFGICPALLGLVFYGSGRCTNYCVSVLYKLKNAICNNKAVSIIAVVLLFMAQILLSRYSEVDLARCIIGNPLSYLGMAFLGIFVYWVISVLIGKSRVLEWAGRNSLVICALHGPVYRAWLFVICYITKTNLIGIRQNVLLCIVVTAITIGTLTPCIYMWNKWGTPLTK